MTRTPLLFALQSDPLGGVWLPGRGRAVAAHPALSLARLGRRVSRGLSARQPDANLDVIYTWTGPLRPPADGQALHTAHGPTARVCPRNVTRRNL